MVRAWRASEHVPGCWALDISVVARNYESRKAVDGFFDTWTNWTPSSTRHVVYERELAVRYEVSFIRHPMPEQPLEHQRMPPKRHRLFVRHDGHYQEVMREDFASMTDRENADYRLYGHKASRSLTVLQALPVWGVHGVRCTPPPMTAPQIDNNKVNECTLKALMSHELCTLTKCYAGLEDMGARNAKLTLRDAHFALRETSIHFNKVDLFVESAVNKSRDDVHFCDASTLDGTNLELEETHMPSSTLACKLGYAVRTGATHACMRLQSADRQRVYMKCVGERGGWKNRRRAGNHWTTPNTTRRADWTKTPCCRERWMNLAGHDDYLVSVVSACESADAPIDLQDNRYYVDERVARHRQRVSVDVGARVTAVTMPFNVRTVDKYHDV